MLQNPFAVRPSYTTLNALQLVHDPIPTLHGPSTILSQRSRIRLQFRHNVPQHVHDPFYSFVTTLYDTFTIPSQRPTTLTTLYNASTIPSTVSLQRHTTLLQRSTTRSQSHHNALRPFYSFVTTSYNPSTTLHNTFTIPLQRSTTLLQFRYNVIQPFHNALRHVHNPITTLYDPTAVSLQTLIRPFYNAFTIPSQRSTTLLQFRYNVVQPFYNALQRVHDPFYSFVYNVIQPFHNALQHIHNPITTLYNAFTIPSTVSLQCHTTLLRRSTTLLATSYNPPTTLYDPSTVSLQRQATLYTPPTVFLTTSYNPSTTLYNPSSNVIQPSYNPLRHVRNTFNNYKTTQCNT